MAQEICEICGIRPATMRVAVMQDGQREELNICEYDYARLTRQQRRSSPMGSLFGDSPFGGDIFGDFMGRAREAMGDGETRARRQAAPDSSLGERQYIDTFSEQAKERCCKGGRADQQGRTARDRH